MTEHEIIVVDGIPRHSYYSIIERSLRYAVLSLPFTFNRMVLSSLKARLVNIAKGKIAEELFFYFARQNHIPLATEFCRTPFYQPDHRDFILNNWEWDIKNNFLTHRGHLLPLAYTELPALVPAQHRHDQWGQRLLKKVSQSEAVAFLFTFMKIRDANNRSSKNFFEFEPNLDQLHLLQRAITKYRGIAQNQPPFAEKSFFREWFKLGGDDKMRFKINDFPALIITGYATSEQFPLFRPVEKNQYFADGALHTRIKNFGITIKELPSFISLFPHLKQGMRFAGFRNSLPASER